MLHAGAVCHPDTSSSIAYAAPGGTGKTTLTRVLGRRYGYLTDETVGILRRTSGRAEAEISRLDLFDAVTALVPETSSLPAMDRPLHLLADLYDELGGFWLLEFGEAEQLTGWIDDRLGGS